MFDKSILGHTGIRQRLSERINANKLAAALLFVGPEGIGKRRVALELAQREICFKREACGICGACALFKASPLPREFPNLLRIAPEGKAGLIKVDAIREDDLVEGGVIRWAHQAAPPGCHRWIVVEDAHRLGKASANMLLKTLEEPPPGTFFILLTHKPDSMLPTIRSRAERVSFSPLNQTEMREIAISRGWAGQELDAWVALSNGTLKYIDRAMFSRACSQIEAWISVMEGVPLKEVSEALLPDKSSELAHSQQTVMALEQLLTVLGELTRASEGNPARLPQWASRLNSLEDKQIDVHNGYKCALSAIWALARNISPEAALRKIALALTQKQ